MDRTSPLKPRVVALGSGAGRVVNCMVRDGTVDADFIALNTDAQDLKRALAPTKLLLGAKMTHGLGAAGDEASCRPGLKVVLGLKGEIFGGFKVA